MMINYQVIIEYLGNNFVGWQKQKNGLSVQEILERALSKYFGCKIIVHGSGRTDAGVHALGQSVTFVVSPKKKIFNKQTFINSINFFLKKYPISILKLIKKKPNFHARHSAKIRTYKYIIINRPSNLAVEFKRAWHVKKKLNITLMKKGIKLLNGKHDFSSFRASSCGAKSPVRTIKEASLKKKNNKIIFSFSSKSFLQKQVRSMVGCLKYLGEEKWDLKYFKYVFKSKKRSLCAPPAPPYGLYLFRVGY
tara:strand:+ start:79 stop:828 length:750 start_codon:yes stop_codon:yes gene_type:complete